MHSKEFAGNQGNHQNFDPSLLAYKYWLMFMGIEQKNLKLLSCQYLLKKEVNQNSLQKFKIHIDCWYEVNTIPIYYKGPLD